MISDEASLVSECYKGLNQTGKHLWDVACRATEMKSVLSGFSRSPLKQSSMAIDGFPEQSRVEAIQTTGWVGGGGAKKGRTSVMQTPSTVDGPMLGKYNS